jgi:hypothetical protein
MTQSKRRARKPHAFALKRKEDVKKKTLKRIPFFYVNGSSSL